MISYAQNAEDVVLARALPASRGFYVDVGAADPVSASVTKHFYDLGWSGINIDPRPAAVEALRAARPRDLNLAIAAGDTDGSVDLFVFDEDPDLSTTSVSDRDFLASQGFGFRTVEVPVRRLDSILEEHGVETVDFLKVDVEGGEKQVLAGLDLAKWQPRVVVVEAVQPWSSIRSDADWRSILLEAGYEEGCFDGINCFFARAGDHEVLGRLFPASVVDDFETAAVVALKDELETLRTYILHLETHIRRSEQGYGTTGGDPASIPAEPRWVSAASPDATRNAGSERKVNRGPVPRPDPRFAVLGTPLSGGEWLSGVLAELFDAEARAVDHPADVDWDDLPRRCVIRMDCTRTTLLADMLKKHSVYVLSPARHPLETLVALWEAAPTAGSPRSGVADPDSFLDWAMSDEVKRQMHMTPSWWAVPSTCRIRFEDMHESRLACVSRVLDRCGFGTHVDPSRVSADAIDLAGGRVRTADVLPASVVQLLERSYEPIFDALNYRLHAA